MLLYALLHLTGYHEMTLDQLKREQPLVDLILDTAEQKGTGKWTSRNSFDLGVPIPTINAAVKARILSALKTERVAAADVLSGPKQTYGGDRRRLIEAVRAALYAAKICAYAQGMALLKAASAAYGYDLDLAAVAAL
jgi:6-phosphogluconate dehydrogenase